jgi:putative CocE/NonD family hydrolase
MSKSSKTVAEGAFSPDFTALKKKLDGKIAELKNSDSLSTADALNLCKAYGSYKVYLATVPPANKILKQIEHDTYIINDSLIVKMPDGGSIAITLVRDRKITTPQPVALRYNIYAGGDIARCKADVQHGYVGVIANTRGKRLSPDVIEPFEHDAKDAYYIIDWISKQPWCNGKVGMYGGSYLGFSQWSAAKYMHPALKTIVPQVSVGIGIDYPQQNGVFMSYYLRWIHFVADNKLIDIDGFSDDKKWEGVFNKWYTSGASFRSLDTLEGRPNDIFQRWLKHPMYDSFWQNMVPQKAEYAKINVPILSTTGYYDDDQLGAMYYYSQYHKWNKNPNYYLLIGPYDHGGSQGSPRAELDGYKIDSAAKVSITELIYEWFDYIMKGKPRPAILQDRVNFEVMGENKWHHVPSLDKMSNDTLKFYLGSIAEGKNYNLLTTKPKTKGYITQDVNLADRTDIDLYKAGGALHDHLIVDSLLRPHPGKLMFVSAPLDKPMAISGALKAAFTLSVNKKDLDIVIDLYEKTADGHIFSLNENLQRASYDYRSTRRKLLMPNKPVTINTTNTFITSRQLQKGSTIIILLGVNKNPSWQINYGTGKDVSEETIKDAAIPMNIKWYNSSWIKLRVLR